MLIYTIHTEYDIWFTKRNIEIHFKELTMPRFTEQEKHIIEQRLLEEGERLFTIYGMKKVTIDDIVKAVNIAKASFYKFYEGKEYLFLDIVQKEQKEIFDALDIVIRESKAKTDGDKVKEVFAAVSVLMRKYPLLARIDEDTVDIIARKVSKERLANFSGQGFDAVKAMEKNGIHFRYSTQVVSQLFQALYQSWISLQGQPEQMQKQVVNIMLDGIVEQIM